MFGVGMLADTVAQIEHMAAAVAETGQNTRDFGFYTVRRTEQCERVEIALQRDFIPHAAAGFADIAGPVQSERIGADVCHLFQPQAAALGNYDNRHPAPFVLTLQTADNLAHIAQAELLKCRVAQYAAPRIENLYRLSAGIDLGIEVGRNGLGVDIKDFVQQIGA